MTRYMMKAALFDLDGVILDTEGMYYDFWSAVGRKYNLQPTFGYDIKGTTLTDILTTYFTNDTQKAEVTKMIHDYENTMVYPVFEGVEAFVKGLKNNGYKTAIVTSSDDVKMSYLKLQHPGLLSYFDAIITGSMVTNSKPDPEGYLLAAGTLGVDIEDCFVFEDSFQGLEAGMKAGATVIGVATTNSRESIKDKAHKVIDSFVDLDITELR